MLKFALEPFDHLNNNLRIWHGKKSVLWYHETDDGSICVIVLYHGKDAKRRILLEIEDHDHYAVFKNDTLSEELYDRLKNEMDALADIAKTHERKIYND